MKNILLVLILLSCGKPKPPAVSDAFDNPAQRDNGSDWAPCTDRELKEHNGADFLFLYGLLKNG